LKSICPDFFYFDGSQNFLGFFRVVPEIRANGYILLNLQGIEFFIDVKDASSGKLLYPLNPALVL